MPVGTVRSMPRRTGWSPYDLVIPVTSMAAGVEWSCAQRAGLTLRQGQARSPGRFPGSRHAGSAPPPPNCARSYMIPPMTTSDGPLTGIRVVDASTILAGPLACQILGDFGAEVIKIEHPRAGDGMRGHGPSRRRHPDLVVGDLAQQAHRRPEPVRGRGRRGLPAPGRHRRRPGRELPPRHPRALGPLPRGAARAQPGPGRRADHRLRPDRAVRRPRRLRHPRRGDERLRAPHRSARRSADPAGLRPRRLDLRHRRVVGDLDGALRARAQRRHGARSSTSACSSRS